jgi:hypothetical protein
MLGIPWTERWLGNGSGEVDQWLLPRSSDLTPLDFFFWAYVKNIVYQVKINNLQHLKDCIKDAVATVTPNMIRPTWNEVEYHLVICHVTKEDHIEIY